MWSKKGTQYRWGILPPPQSSIYHLIHASSEIKFPPGLNLTNRKVIFNNSIIRMLFVSLNSPPSLHFIDIFFFLHQVYCKKIILSGVFHPFAEPEQFHNTFQCCIFIFFFFSSFLPFSNGPFSTSNHRGQCCAFLRMWLCRKHDADSRAIRCTPDWSENAVAGDHLWVPTSVSGDCCYVGDNECVVST